MTWAIAAISVSEQIEKYGAYAGLAAIVGLGVLSLLYFAQAREVKRLREWAGRAPERAAELEARVAAEAALRTSGAPLRPQTAAGQAATSASPASPASPAVPAVPGAPAAAPAGAKPAAGDAKPPAPVPGLPVAVPATSGAPVAGAFPAPAPAAAGPTSAPAPDAPAQEEPAKEEPAKQEPAEEPVKAPAGGSNGAPAAPAEPAGPRVPGRPPPGSTVTPPPVAPTTNAGAAGPPPVEDATTVRPLRGGPPSRTLPPRETADGHRTPSRRTLGVIGGALAVVAAVAIVLVLTLGGEETPPPPNQVAETTGQTTPAEPGRTQSSRQARIDRADTPVAVLNATGVNGLARQVADRLQSTGYQAAVDNTQSRPATVIGFKEGAEPAAREIGKLLEVPSGQIQPMPSELTPIAGNNAVVVVIGADKASD